MKIGFSKEKITPQYPMRLCGYGNAQISTGIHDDLWVKVVLFQQEKGYIGLLSYDLLAVDNYLKSKIIEQLSADYQLVLTATHTHQGPNGVLNSELKDLFAPLDERYHQYLVKQTVRAILKAQELLEPFTAKMGYNWVSDAYSNRHSMDHFYNQKLTVIQFETNSEKVYGLVNFSCHPTILKEDNTLFSKDLIWGIENHLQGFDEVMFLNGTAGDISTRFVRTSSDYQQVDKTGKQIATTIMATALTPLNPLTNLTLKTYAYQIRLKTPRAIETLDREIKKVEVLYQKAESAPEKRNLQTMIEGLQAEKHRADFLLKHKNLNIKYSILDFQEFSFVGFPLEVFSILAKDVFELHPTVMVISYVDGYFSYLVDNASYQQEIYEAGSTLFERGEGERLFYNILQKL